MLYYDGNKILNDEIKNILKDKYWESAKVKHGCAINLEKLGAVLGVKVHVEQNERNIPVFFPIKVISQDELRSQFKKNRDFIRWKSEQVISLEQRKSVENYIENTINSADTITEEPPEKLKKWLKTIDYNFPLKDEHECYVHQSVEWLEENSNIISPENQKWLFLHEAMFEIAETTDYEKVELVPYQNKEKGYDIYIVYQRLKIKGQEIHFFIYHNDEKEKINIDKFRTKYNFTGLSEEEKETKLLKLSRRTYIVDVLLKDVKTWIKIETNPSANLTLSAEEKKLLHEVKFPLFINGQAGSGKSTMLYYLFAEFCFQKIKESLEGEPVFLTYSDQLIENARCTIQDILMYFPRYHCSEEQLKNSNFDTFFFPFGKFVQQFLPEDDFFRENFLQNAKIAENKNKKYKKIYSINDRINDEKHLDFVKFRELYDNQYCGEKKYSPEIIWHVVRTYIKGYSLNYYLSPKEYENKFREEKRTVSLETYNDIYFKVWEKWYKKISCTDVNLKKLSYGKISAKQLWWDDLDLIRYVIHYCDIASQKNNESKKYPIIFCDEAQDFTRVEIEFLAQISSFYLYDISGYKNVPFAFAGDPFQTINPTGFRWEQIKSYFYEKLVQFQHWDREEQDNMMKELKYNYRSRANVVKFANLVQRYRYILFEETKLTPQKSYFEHTENESEKTPNEDKETPPMFGISENLSPEKLQQIKKSNVSVIIPYEAKEREKDDIIKNIKNSEKDASNILTCMEAKGRQFRRILLVNFGQEFINLLGCSLNKVKENIENEDVKIKLSYFFNKLYVAVTRAEQEMYILDTQDGFELFWKYFNQENCPQDIKNSDWKKDLIFLGKPNDNFVIVPMTEPEMKQRAESSRDLGYQRRDAGSYKYAAKDYQYLAINGTEKNLYKKLSEECFALAWEIEKKWETAGVKYIEIQKYEEAMSCFWNGKLWNRFCGLEGLLNNDEYRAKRDASKFMLDNNYQFVLDIDNKNIGADDVWKVVLENFSKQVLNQEEKLSVDDLKRIIGKFSDLVVNRPFPFLEVAYIKLLFSITGRYDDHDWKKRAIEKYENYRKYDKEKHSFSKNIKNQYISWKIDELDCADLKIQFLRDHQRTEQIFDFIKKDEEIKHPDTIDSIFKLCERENPQIKMEFIFELLLNNSRHFDEKREDWRRLINLWQENAYNNNRIKTKGQKLVDEILAASQDGKARLIMLVIEMLVGKFRYHANLLVDYADESKKNVENKKSVLYHAKKIVQLLKKENIFITNVDIGTFIGDLENLDSESAFVPQNTFLNLRDYSVVGDIQANLKLAPHLESTDIIAKLIKCIYQMDESLEKFEFIQKIYIAKQIYNAVHHSKLAVGITEVATAYEKLQTYYNARVDFYQKVYDNIEMICPNSNEKEWINLRYTYSLYRSIKQKIKDFCIDEGFNKKMLYFKEISPLEYWKSKILIDEEMEIKIKNIYDAIYKLGGNQKSGWDELLNKIPRFPIPIFQKPCLEPNFKITPEIFSVKRIPKHKRGTFDYKDDFSVTIEYSPSKRKVTVENYDTETKYQFCVDQFPRGGYSKNVEIAVMKQQFIYKNFTVEIFKGEHISLTFNSDQEPIVIEFI